jgi:hypothetical protein
MQFAFAIVLLFLFVFSFPFFFFILFCLIFIPFNAIGDQPALPYDREGQ